MHRENSWVEGNDTQHCMQVDGQPPKLRKPRGCLSPTCIQLHSQRASAAQIGSSGAEGAERKGFGAAYRPENHWNLLRPRLFCTKTVLGPACRLAGRAGWNRGFPQDRNGPTGWHGACEGLHTTWRSQGRRPAARRTETHGSFP
ncbi:hypothetical protein [Azospirillum endophyticum]